MEQTVNPLKVGVRLEPPLEHDRSTSPTENAVLLLKPIRSNNLRTIPLTSGRLTLGRSAESDIRLDLEGVADQHCLFIVGQRNVIFRAFSPLTWLNDGAIREGTLRVGDRLILGPAEFVVATAEIGEPVVSVDSPVSDLLREAAARRNLSAALQETQRKITDEQLHAFVAAAPEARAKKALTPTPPEAEAALAEMIAQSEAALRLSVLSEPKIEAAPPSVSRAAPPSIPSEITALAADLDQQRRDFERERERFQSEAATHTLRHSQRAAELTRREQAIAEAQQQLHRQAAEKSTQQLDVEPPTARDERHRLSSAEGNLARQHGEVARLRREWEQAHTELAASRGVIAQRVAEHEQRVAEQRQIGEERHAELTAVENRLRDVESRLRAIREQQTQRARELLDREIAVADREERTSQTELAQQGRETELIGLESRLTALNSDLAGRLSECTRREIGLTHWEKKLSAQTGELSLREAEVDRQQQQVTARHAEAQAAAEELEQTRAELQRQITSLEKGEQQLASEREQFAAARSQGEIEQTKLTNERALLDSELAQWETDRSEWEATLKQFHHERANFAAAQSTWQGESSKLAATYAQAELNTQQLATDRARLEWDRSQIQAERQDLNNLRFAHQERLNVAERQALEFERSAAEFAERQSQSAQELADLKARLEVATSFQEAHTEADRHASERIQRLKEQQAQRDLEHQQLVAELEGCRRQLSERESEVACLRVAADQSSTVASSNSGSSALSEVTGALRAEHQSQLSQMRQEFEQQRKELVTQIHDLESQLTASQQAAALSASAATTASEDCQVHPELVAQLEAVLAERDTLTSLRADLENRRMACDDEAIRYSRDLAKTEDERRLLAEKLAEAESERALYLTQRQALIHDRQQAEELQLKIRDEQNRIAEQQTELAERQSRLTDEQTDVAAVRQRIVLQEAELTEWRQDLEAERTKLEQQRQELLTFANNLPAVRQLEHPGTDEPFEIGESAPSEPLTFAEPAPAPEPEPPAPVVLEYLGDSEKDKPLTKEASLRSHLASLFGIPMTPSPAEEIAREYPVETATDAPQTPIESPLEEPAPEAESAASEPAAEPEEETEESAGGDDSVAEYMERLLARSRRTTNDAPGAAPVKRAVAKPKPVEAVVTTEAVPAELVTPAARKTLNPEERELLRANLDSFREVANLNARMSVARHKTHRMHSQLKIRVAICAVAIVLAILLLTAHLWGRHTYEFEGRIASVFAVSMIGLTVVNWLNLQRARNVDGKRLKASPPEPEKPVETT